MLGSAEFLVARKNNNNKQPNKAPKGKQPKKRSKSDKRSSAEQVFGVMQRFMAPQKPMRSKVAPGVQLSSCAARYALAIAEPFHPNARGACLPTFPSVDSHKATAFGRITVTAGTAGVGFAAFSPSIASDVPFVYSTTSAYAGTDVNILSAVNTVSTGVVYNYCSNLPYSSTTLLSNVAYGGATLVGRIVSFGAKITYVGTTLNEGGVMYSYTSPTHENVTLNAYNASYLGALVETDVCGITREACSLTSIPSNATETAYTNAQPDGDSNTAVLYPHCNGETGIVAYSGGIRTPLTFQVISSPVTSAGVPTSLFYFSGVTAGSTFLVEYVIHCEYSGLSAAGSASPSDADQRGFELVTAASSRIPQLKNADVRKRDNWSLMKQAIGEVAQKLKPIAVDAIVKGATAMML